MHFIDLHESHIKSRDSLTSSKLYNTFHAVLVLMLSHSPHSETVHGPRAVNYPDIHTVGVPNGLEGESPPRTTDDIKAVVEVSASAYSWS